jgi:hypothetical protein
MLRRMGQFFNYRLKGFSPDQLKGRDFNPFFPVL